MQFAIAKGGWDVHHALMSLELPKPDPAPPVPVVEFPQPDELHQAFSDPLRYRAMRELSAGSYLTATELAGRLGASVDGMAKHMRVLLTRRAVILVMPEGGDRRAQYYQIPQRFRSTSESGRAVVDYGVCVLRF